MATGEVPVVTNWYKHVTQPLTEEEKPNEEAVMKTRVQFYTDHVESYDGDMAMAGFCGPEMVAKALHQQLDGNFEACVLDAGCGTGRVAELLLQLGPYTNLVGLDPSEGMVDVARKRNLYKEFKQQYMYLDCGLGRDTYDAVISSGAFAPGHMKSNCLIEMCNITKPGGYIVITMRQEQAIADDGSGAIETLASKLVSEGQLEVIKDKIVSGYVTYRGGAGLDGHLYVFRKL